MDEKELIAVIMQAAVELVQTYNSGLTDEAMRVRMKRIAADLVLAAEEKQ